MALGVKEERVWCCLTLVGWMPAQALKAMSLDDNGLDQKQSSHGEELSALHSRHNSRSIIIAGMHCSLDNEGMDEGAVLCNLKLLPIGLP